MNTKPRRVMQLTVTTADKPGILAEITSVLAKDKINIEAICAYGDETEAICYLIVRNNEKAKKALKASGWDVKEEEVVVIDLENNPGALNTIANKLKKLNVNLRYCYGTTTEAAGPCHFVLKATDNDLAVNALSSSK